ncbi:MAG: beta strand repeat-containing protein, partial [Acutalibacteraceae bacterium]
MKETGKLIWCKRIVSILTAFVVLIAGFNVSAVAASTGTYPITNNTCAINTYEQLVEYSQAYSAAPDVYCNVDLAIAITGDCTASDLVDFVSVGTELYPFEATITINNSNLLKIYLGVPLFAYISDTSKIIGTDDSISPVTIISTSTAAAPLFAENVVHSSDTEYPRWSVVVGKPSDSNAKDFGGIIGTVGENARVDLNIDNTVNASVSSAGNVGLACGTMGTNSALNVTVKSPSDGSDCTYSVTSSGGNSGGIVGYMDAGSTLTVNSSVKTMGTITASEYAGGLVGYAKDSAVNFLNNSDKTVTQTVSGTSGTGGIFGCYENTKDQSFDISSYSIDCTLNGINNGGLFGELKNTAAMTISGGTADTLKSTFASSESADYGGIVGTCSGTGSTFFANIGLTAVKSEAATAKNYGGVIGNVSADAYISFSNVTVSASNCSTSVNLFGGLVAYSALAFIDAENVTVNTKTSVFNGGGIVGNLVSGVLRLSGTTDLSKAGTDNSTMTGEYGQIVKIRGNQALVYAKDSTGNEWKLIRNTTGQQYYDDIYSWGEVLRLDGTTELSESNVLDVDETAHTVTLKAPTVTDGAATVSSLAEFAKLALNIQLNDGSDIGRLHFADTSNNSAALLGGNITLNTDIDLSGTGITGLTRDNGTNEFYTGTFNGNNHTITLAIGEAYGYRGNADTPISAEDTTAGNGVIYRHAYNGLFAKTGDGATFNDLTVAGSVKVDTNVSNMFVGGLSAEHQSGSITIDNVKSEQNVFLNGNDNGNYSNACGGFIGRTSTNQAHTIDIINNSTISPTITTESKKNPFYTGGAIGVISSTDKAVTVNADNVTISATITNNSSSASNYGTSKKAGGFIAYIASGTSGTRTMSLKNITVNGTSIETGYGLGGALLGEQWNNIDVTIGEKVVTNAVALAEGIVVLEDTSAFGSPFTTFEDNSKFNDIFGKTTTKSSSAISSDVFKKQLNDEIAAFSESENTTTGVTVTNSTVTYSGSSDFGGLVSVATGYWQVNDIDINGLTVDGGSASSFGMLVGRGVNRDNNQKYALYLETTGENAYTINASNTTLSLGSAIFDELVADCRNRNDSNDATGYGIASNSNAVVSIHTSTPSGATEPKVIMDGANCNTYKNQTGIEISNPNTRYYYNLDVIRAKNTDDLSAPEKLMLWSVNNYAYSTIKSNFNNPFTDNIIVADTYDMNGYSYYPIDISSATTIESGCKFKFYNIEIEAGESGTGNADSLPRSTVAADSQHYLMHCGLFRNVSAALTVDNITLQGNVGKTDGSGALICGTVSGSATSNTNITVNGVTLDGVAVNDVSDYAPLLINNIGNYSKLTLKNVTTTSAYTTNGITIAATSLIGNVGGENGDQIKLVFGQLTLDSRKQALSNDATNAALTNVYNTATSIFSRATLLNSFQYTTGKNCSAIYNYKYTEDWTDATTPKHNVTYGTEITSSAEYANQEKNYISSDYFTNPDELTKVDNYDFTSTYFLPYVYTGYSEADNSHEVKVNVTNKANLDKGCGTYNDPYIIENKDQVMLISEILNEGTPSQYGTIINWHADNYKSWCDSKDSSSHTVYVWDSDSAAFYPAKTDENGDTVADTSKSNYTIANMRTALSTAYYKLGQDITLGADFLGLGTKSYFKGVIDGAGYTITNESKNPLIYSSLGSVVKNLNVSVTADFSDKFKVDATSKYETDGGTTEFYGGLIGIVNGGDNIIDNVSVTFADNTISKINVKSNSNYGNRAVGGYIGVVRYGGVFFRNMETADKSGIASFSTDSYQYLLYCNPIIGRVIDGFAVTESDSYKPSETGTTMKNGTKNYSIADIDKNGGQITFDDNKVISVPDAQSLFIMGCIAMSGVGSANTSTGKYSSYSYGSSQMVRGAEYNHIGEDTATDDYNLAKGDNFANTSVPYIISKYTNDTTLARKLTTDTFSVELTGTETTYTLPDGFRGIGSMNNSSDDLEMTLSEFNGNGNTIEMNSNFRAYKLNGGYDQYYKPNTNQTSDLNVGLGLFNKLVMSGNSEIKDLTLTGNATVTVYTNHNNANQEKDGNASMCAGMLAGISMNTFTVEDVKLSNVNVDTMSISGGLIGILRNSSGRTFTANRVSADNLSVAGGQCAGGLVGYVYGFTCNINKAESQNSEFLINTISAKSSSGGWSSVYQGCGGIFGAMRKSTVDINNISVDKSTAEGSIGSITSVSNTAFAGGVIGCGKNESSDTIKISITNANVKNIDMGYYGPTGTTNVAFFGGVIGGVKKAENTTINLSNISVIGDETNSNTILSGSEAAGLIGLQLGEMTADNCTVENYNLQANINKATEGIG